jgi:hypothetical protein
MELDLQAAEPVDGPAGGAGWAAPARGGAAGEEIIQGQGSWGNVSAQNAAATYRTSEEFLATPLSASSAAHP